MAKTTTLNFRFTTRKRRPSRRSGTIWPEGCNWRSQAVADRRLEVRDRMARRRALLSACHSRCLGATRLPQMGTSRRSRPAKRDTGMNDVDLLDAEQTGGLLRVPSATVRRLWRIGRLAYVEPTRNRRYSTREQITEYLASVTRPCRSATPPSSSIGAIGCSGAATRKMGGQLDRH